MIKVVKTYGYNMIDYIVSKEEEIAELPKNVGQGSTAFVIATSTAYMFDEEAKQWKKL